MQDQRIRWQELICIVMKENQQETDMGKSLKQQHFSQELLQEKLPVLNQTENGLVKETFIQKICFKNLAISSF